jgi:hypothetical protein
MTTILNPSKIDFLENLNTAIEILQIEADNTQMFTRGFELMAGRADMPRSIEIGHQRRLKVLAALDQLKILRLQQAGQ